MRGDIKKGLAELLGAAEAMSSDVGAAVEEILREGLGNPLSANEARALLARVVDVVRRGATKRGDTATVALLDRDAEALIERVEQVRARLSDGTRTSHSTPNVSGSDHTVQSVGLQRHAPPLAILRRNRSGLHETYASVP